MDKLDRAIAAAREELGRMDVEMSALQARRKDAATRLAIYEEAARLRPPAGREGVLPSLIAAQSATVRRGGRQAGAISKEWKRILVETARRDQGEGVGYPDFIAAARQTNPNMDEHAIRDRVRRYRDKLRFVEAIGDRFRIKKEIVEKFAADLGDQSPQEGEDAEATDQPQSEEPDVNDLI
jgi:hypothetical protein